MNLINMGIVELINGLQKGSFGWTELQNAYRRRIENKNPDINAFVIVDYTEPTTVPGNLMKIPFAIKDIVDCAGFPTRAGSSFYCQPSPSDAFAVAQLRSQGAWMVGKTNTHEFAAGGTTLNPHFGPTRNPWDLGRIAGGSSGGSAAAVTARMAVAAIGTDSAGSIRLPAAFCGVVGLKPTYGRISRQGVVPLSWSLDHVGPLARTIDDLQIVYTVMAQADSQDATTQFCETTRPFPTPLRIGLVDPPSGFGLAWHPEVTHAVDQSARWLEKAGAQLSSVALPYWEASLAANFTIIRSEFSTIHRRWLSSHPDGYGEDVRVFLETGLRISAVDYLEAQRIRNEVVAAYGELFRRVDLLVLPTAPTLPPSIADLARLDYNRTQGTAPFDLSGLPALTVPFLGSSRLPIGIQLIAPWWQEAWLFTAGHQIEKARGPLPWPE